MPCVRPERSGGTARASQPETAGIGAVAVWSNELEPRRLLLSSPSRGLWINVVDHVERAIARVETVIRSAACEQAGRASRVGRALRRRSAACVWTLSHQWGSATCPTAARMATRQSGVSQRSRCLISTSGVLTRLATRQRRVSSSPSSKITAGARIPQGQWWPGSAGAMHGDLSGLTMSAYRKFSDVLQKQVDAPAPPKPANAR
jgi:hypothetical protein